MTKNCSKCGLVKPLDDFYRTKTTKIGRLSACISCFQVGNRESYFKNRERLIALRKSYKEANRERVATQKRAQYQRAKARGYWNTPARKEARRRFDAANRERIRRRDRLKYWSSERFRLRSVIRASYRRSARVPWADRAKIGAFYAEARMKTKTTGIKHVVDHIIPIKNPMVCGLHVETNLRVITEYENAVKKNHLLPELLV